MTANSPSPGNQNPIYSTEYGIPIRNLWHMLLYAWNEAPVFQLVAASEVENAPTLDVLLALALVRLMQQRMRTGLGHSYVNEARTLRGVRGRINFSESLKHHSFEKGEASCEFEAYTVNEPRNQIVRSTLVRLVQAGEFGPDKTEAETLRQRLRWLVRNLDGIELIELTPDLVGRHRLSQNDHDYRLMLSVCELILQRQMPLDAEGTHPLPRLDKDALILHRIYERFVAGFYRMHLRDWEVLPQKRLDWHAAEPSDQLPSMIPDLVMQNKETGQMVILDTKFTGSLVENQWGKPVYDSSHLYQLYAYLRSQEHLSEVHRTASGILLYPAIQNKSSQQIQLQEHVIRMECVDLAAPWQVIERQMLELIQ